MSSRVIKFVAGGGKTYWAREFIKKNYNGIYLAFNNKVVDDITYKGYLSKTIDSFFVSYILPKLFTLIPIIGNDSDIQYCASETLPNHLKGVMNLHIKPDGVIYNKTQKTKFNLSIPNSKLQLEKQKTNLNLVKKVFTIKTLNLTDQMRADLCEYCILNYGDKIVELIESRFNYVIIDEAQDLSGFREDFAKLISNGNLNLILLGDDNQNINSGGSWFRDLNPNETKTKSFRCPEGVCEWIREKLDIEIFGTEKIGKVYEISNEELSKLDNQSRVLLYTAAQGNLKNTIEQWCGPKLTIKKAKGQTINEDIVIIGKFMNKKNMYTAITRTTKSVYITAKLNNN